MIEARNGDLQMKAICFSRWMPWLVVAGLALFAINSFADEPGPQVVRLVKKPGNEDG